MSSRFTEPSSNVPLSTVWRFAAQRQYRAQDGATKALLRAGMQDIATLSSIFAIALRYEAGDSAHHVGVGLEFLERLADFYSEVDELLDPSSSATASSAPSEGPAPKAPDMAKCQAAPTPSAEGRRSA